MTFEKAVKLISEELKRAERIHPVWPKDVVHGAAILAEEAGEVVKAALDEYYGRGAPQNLQEEVVQTAAMALKFLLSFTDDKENK